MRLREWTAATAVAVVMTGCGSDAQPQPVEIVETAPQRARPAAAEEPLAVQRRNLGQHGWTVKDGFGADPASGLVADLIAVKSGVQLMILEYRTMEQMLAFSDEFAATDHDRGTRRSMSVGSRFFWIKRLDEGQVTQEDMYAAYNAAERRR